MLGVLNHQVNLLALPSLDDAHLHLHCIQFSLHSIFQRTILYADTQLTHRPLSLLSWFASSWARLFLASAWTFVQDCVHPEALIAAPTKSNVSLDCHAFLEISCLWLDLYRHIILQSGSSSQHQPRSTDTTSKLNFNPNPYNSSAAVLLRELFWVSNAYPSLVVNDCVAPMTYSFPTRSRKLLPLSHSATAISHWATVGQRGSLTSCSPCSFDARAHPSRCCCIRNWYELWLSALLSDQQLYFRESSWPAASDVFAPALNRSFIRCCSRYNILESLHSSASWFPPRFFCSADVVHPCNLITLHFSCILSTFPCEPAS